MSKVISSPSKRLHNSWSFYDWANSAYNLVITSTIFPVYYIAVTSDNNPETLDYARFFGLEFINSALLNYSLAAAYLIIALLSPILSSIADVQGNKKQFLKFFCYLGGLACCGLFFFTPGRTELGILLSMTAALGYCGSLVFYNAYLPEIATPDQRNQLSARGYAFGYVGSVLLQLVCFALLFVGFADDSLAARLSFLLVGLWWMGFAQITFRNMPDSRGQRRVKDRSVLWQGFRELRKVYSMLADMPVLKRFLTAFFFYSMGLQTVMLAAAEFGSKEVYKLVDGERVPLEAADLILTILLIQLVAIGGAYLLSGMARRLGNLRVLRITVLIWIAICCCAYFTHTQYQFYALAAAVGLVMGGIQSLSRATYAKLMPETADTTSFFSFYDVSEKVAIVIGMFSFALLEDLTGSMRNSIILLTLFFVVGLVFLALAGKKA